MKILCVIPAYNAAKFIAATIKAIRKQSFKNVHVVVIDDYSTDDTYSEALLAGATVFRNQQNIGAYQSLNFALSSFLSHDAFYFHGADDISFENHFELLSMPLIMDPAVMMAYCNYNRVDYKSGKLIDTYLGSRTSMCLYRSEVYYRMGPYDNTRFGGDTEYWDRFLFYFHHGQIAHINRPLANCMVHQSNLTVLHGMNERREYVSQYKERHRLLASGLSPF